MSTRPGRTGSISGWRRGRLRWKTLSWSAFQPGQQARRIPTLAAHFLDLRIERIDQCGDRQAGAIAARFVEANREILAHPLHRKTEIEFAVVHGLVAVVHLPGLGGAFRDGVDHGLDVETRILV